MIIVLISYLAIGALAGTLSGLLGIGGGIIVVPTLAYLFKYQHFSDAMIMHLAIGSSLGAMCFTTSMSAKTHLKLGNLPKDVACVFVPGIILGTFCGSALANSLSNALLHYLFSFFLLASALQVILNVKPKQAKKSQTHPAMLFIAGTSIGTIASILGIGGSILSVPFFLYISLEMRKCVALASLCTVPVAVFGSIGFIIMGSMNPERPAHAIGYIYWPAVLGLATGGVIFAPLGAKLAHYVSNNVLKICFILFLITMAGVMMLSQI